MSPSYTADDVSAIRIRVTRFWSGKRNRTKRRPCKDNRVNPVQTRERDPSLPRTRGTGSKTGLKRRVETYRRY
ncbi:uncharacterized protein LOC144468469 isoform X2 [Augochlora pura]